MNGLYVTSKKISALQHIRAKGLRVGTTNGCFDLLHPGHVHYLRECKKRLGNGILIVLVNNDLYCQETKGKGRPIIREEDRIMMVKGIKGVWFAWLFSEKDPTKWVKKIKPDVHFKGEDWKDKEVPESQYAPVKFVPLLEGYSTTQLVSKIRGKHGRHSKQG